MYTKLTEEEYIEAKSIVNEGSKIPFRPVSIVRGVYMLFHVASGYIYIGSSEGIRKRFSQHVYELKNNKNECGNLQELYNLFLNKEIKLFIFQHDVKDLKEKEDIYLELYKNKTFLSNISESAYGNFGVKITDANKLLAKNRLTVLWKNPQWREKAIIRLADRKNNATFIKKMSDINIKRYTDVNERIKTSIAVKKSWDNVERRNKASDISKEYSNRPEVKLKRSNLLKNNWKNLDYREKISLAIKKSANTPERKLATSIMFKEYANRPEVKLKKSETIKNLFKDEEYRINNKNRLESYNLIKSKAISINGVMHSSVRGAARDLGIARHVIKRNLKDENNPDYIYLLPEISNFKNLV